MVVPLRRGFGVLVLTEEILFAGRRQGRVRIRRGHQAVLVGIDAQLLAEFQADLEGRAGILILQHLRRLRSVTGDIAGIPGLEVGELIIGRQERVRLFVTLHLRDFMQRLPTNTFLCVFAGHRFALGRKFAEHQAVRQVAVMRYRKRLATGLFFIPREIIPELFRVGAVKHRERQRLRGLLRTVAMDDDAMLVVARRRGGPLEAGHRSEPARFVVLVRFMNKIDPDAARCIVGTHRVGKGRRRAHLNDLCKGFHPTFLPGAEHLMDLPAPGISQQFRRR